MKRWLSVVLVLVLIFSLATPGFAEGNAGSEANGGEV